MLKQKTDRTSTKAVILGICFITLIFFALVLPPLLLNMLSAGFTEIPYTIRATLQPLARIGFVIVLALGLLHLARASLRLEGRVKA